MRLKLRLTMSDGDLKRSSTRSIAWSEVVVRGGGEPPTFRFSRTRVPGGHSPGLVSACDPRATSLHPHSQLVPPEVPERVVHYGARDVADPAQALVGIVAERDVLGGDALRSLQGLRRPADQQPDRLQAHLEQP